MDIIEDTIVPFGKHKGKHISTLLADKAYLQWCKNNNIITEQKYPHIYNTIYCVNVVSNTDNTPTPEHNEMQNTFLDTKLQVNLLKYLFKNKLNTIAQSLFSQEFERFYGKYDDIIDKALSDCIQSVTFEEKFNWDVVINSTNLLSFESVYYESYTNTIVELIQSLRTTYNNNKMPSEFLCDWLVSQESIDTEVRKKLQYNIDKYKYTEKRSNSNVWKFYKEELIELYCDIKFQDIYKHKYIYDINVSQSDDVSICCELKPSLGDDYPCVLRKMVQQIEHTKNYIKNHYSSEKFNSSLLPILIINNYNSKVTSIDKLKEIFKKHKIRVILLKDIHNDKPNTIDYDVDDINRVLQQKIDTLTAENERLRQQLMKYDNIE